MTFSIRFIYRATPSARANPGIHLFRQVFWLPVHPTRLTFPSIRTVALTAFVTGYSGATAADFHRLPFEPIMAAWLLHYNRSLFLVKYFFLALGPLNLLILFYSKITGSRRMDSLALRASVAISGCVSFRDAICLKLSAVLKTSIAMSPSEIPAVVIISFQSMPLAQS